MKKILGLVLAGGLGVTLIGCGGEPDTPPVEDVSTETDLGGGSSDPSAMMEDTAASEGEPETGAAEPSEASEPE